MNNRGAAVPSKSAVKRAALSVSSLVLCAFLLVVASAPTWAVAASHTELPGLSGFTRPCGVATDSHSYTYIAEIPGGDNGKIKIFDASGSFVTERIVGTFGSVGCDLTVDSAGNIFYIEGLPSSAGNVIKLKLSTGLPVTESTVYLSETITSKATGVAVDLSSQKIFVSKSAASEEQRIEISKATGGTYKLKFNGEETSALAFSATSATVATALRALPSIGATGVNVAGALGNTTLRQRSVTFAGPLANTDVPQIEVISSLTCTEPTPGCPASIINKTLTIGAAGGHIAAFEPNGTPISASTGSGVSGASYYGLDVYGANGRIYAADKANNKAYIFGPPGTTPLKEVDGSDCAKGAFTGMEWPAVAVDQSNGNFLVSDIKGHGVVDEFNAAGKCVTTIEHDPAFVEAEPSDIAVDSSSSSNRGNVYVTSGTSAGSVFAYDALEPTTVLSTNVTPAGKGTVLCNGTEAANPLAACASEYAEESSITLNGAPSAGYKFKEWKGGTGSATSCNGTTSACTITLTEASEITAEFEVSGPTVTTTVGATERTQTSAKVAGTVNPNGTEVSQANCGFKYGLTASYGSVSECESAPGAGSGPVPVTATLSGLEPATTYHFKLVAKDANENSGEGTDQTFTTKPPAPTVTNDAPGAASQTTAVLKGHVDNEGDPAGSACKFQIALEGSPGTPVSEPACAPNPVPGTTSTAVEATASGLTANTTYVYRVVATNEGGSSTGTPDQAVQTLPNVPTVSNDAPGTITQTSIVLKGSVDNNGATAGSTCKFVIATEATPGTPLAEPACSTNPVTGSGATAVEATASGLTANTQYVYRVVATNTGGTSTGTPDKAAQTLPNAPSVVTQAANPVSKNTATLNGTVDPNGGTVSDCHFKYGLTTGYGSTVNCVPVSPLAGDGPIAVSAEISGLTASTPYHFQLVATNSGGTGEGSDVELTTTVNSPPSVTNANPGTITQTSIVLKGTVNNNGIAGGSSCKFQIALESSPGTPLAEPACSPDPVTGSTGTPVEATASGLTANTTYVYRVVATNSDGTSTGTPDKAAQTLPNVPTVTNDAPGTITQTSIVLKGSVDNNGAAAGSTCKFVIATEATPGTPLAEPACSTDPVPGSGDTAVEATASGLTANTKYVYRVVATNTGGSSTGTPDKAAQTLPNAPSVTNDAPGTITQTSIVLKGSVDNNGATAGSTCKFVIATEATPGTPLAEPACSTNPVTGSGSTAVEATASSLTANTKYVYRVVATNAGGTSTGTPDKAAQTLPNAPTVSTDPEGTVTQTTAVLNGHVNNEGSPTGSACSFQVALASDPTYAAASTVPCTTTPVTGTANTAVTATATGLSPNTAYIYRVRAAHSGGDPVNGSSEGFTTPVSPPTVTNANPGTITQTSIVLKGSVDNNGAAAGSTCKFVIATEATPGTPLAEPACSTDPVPGSGATAVEATASGLTANTQYVYRVVATNTGGTSTGTPDKAAQTLPNSPMVTTTAGGTAIAQTSAKVAGSVNPNGGAVSNCKVEYGLTTSYSSEASCGSLPGASSSAVGVSATLTGLAANTTYHFRVVATNAGGTGEGADQEFKTLADTCETNASLCPPKPEDPKPPAPPSNEAKPGAAKAQGENVMLKLSVPGAGTLKATGKNLAPTTGSAKGAGTVSLKLKLTGAGKKALKKKGKLKVKVKIVFTPTGGAPGTSTKTVTFKAKGGK